MSTSQLWQSKFLRCNHSSLDQDHTDLPVESWINQLIRHRYWHILLLIHHNHSSLLTWFSCVCCCCSLLLLIIKVCVRRGWVTVRHTVLMMTGMMSLLHNPVWLSVAGAGSWVHDTSHRKTIEKEVRGREKRKLISVENSDDCVKWVHSIFWAYPWLSSSLQSWEAGPCLELPDQCQLDMKQSHSGGDSVVSPSCDHSSTSLSPSVSRAPCVHRSLASSLLTLFYQELSP